MPQVAVECSSLRRCSGLHRTICRKSPGNQPPVSKRSTPNPTRSASETSRGNAALGALRARTLPWVLTMHDVDRQNPAPSSRGFAFDDAALARVNCLGTPPRPGVLNRGSRLPLGKKRPTEVPFEATGPLTTPSPLWEKLSDAHPTYGIDVVALTLAVALPTRCRQPERRSLSNSPLTRLPSTARDRPSLPPQLPLLMIQHGAAAGHFPQPQSIAERRAVKRTAPTPAACGKARVRLASREAEEDWVPEPV
jgi:hypothetical protein